MAERAAKIRDSPQVTARDLARNLAAPEKSRSLLLPERPVFIFDSSESGLLFLTFRGHLFGKLHLFSRRDEFFCLHAISFDRLSPTLFKEEIFPVDRGNGFGPNILHQD